MMPAHPPLPTASNFSFQFWTGSQTSDWIVESDEGVSVIATRQNAGSTTVAAFEPLGASRTCRGAVPGPNVHAPAACVVAETIVTWGNVSAVKRSHDRGCGANTPEQK